MIDRAEPSNHNYWDAFSNGLCRFRITKMQFLIIAMTAVGTSETYLQQFPVLLLCLEDRCADRAVLHPQIWRVIEKRHPPT